jgi:hypothetical protein
MFLLIFSLALVHIFLKLFVITIAHVAQLERAVALEWKDTGSTPAGDISTHFDCFFFVIFCLLGFRPRSANTPQGTGMGPSNLDPSLYFSILDQWMLLP